jgi:hypothetical protein
MVEKINRPFPLEFDCRTKSGFFFPDGESEISFRRFFKLGDIYMHTVFSGNYLIDLTGKIVPAYFNPDIPRRFSPIACKNGVHDLFQPAVVFDKKNSRQYLEFGDFSLGSRNSKTNKCAGKQTFKKGISGNFFHFVPLPAFQGFAVSTSKCNTGESI